MCIRDSDKALDLYNDSLAIDERLGDVKGKSATLHAMANVWVTRGDLDKALDLYNDSLAIKERLGDVQGRSTTLSMMANVQMNRGRWDEAKTLVEEALKIAKTVSYTHLDVYKRQVSTRADDPARVRNLAHPRHLLLAEGGAARRAGRD